jgi:diguanylate cyclase (GGDEF)-like protein
MTNRSLYLDKRLAGLSSAIEHGLHALSAFALPVLVGLFSLLALWLWPSQFSGDPATGLAFRHASQAPTETWTPAEARRVLQTAPTALQWDSQRSEAPVWFALDIPANTNAATARALDFPSRHAVEMTCWDAQTLTTVGHASRSGNYGGLDNSRAGFALQLPPSVANTPLSLVCRGQFLGPARFTAQVWNADDLALKTQEFYRNSGLLDGGLLVLAVFILIAGLTNRDSHYLLFAAWLVVNLRMAALSSGWDHQWLGMVIPFEWLVHLRPLTLALYYVVTVALFKSLFGPTLEQIGKTTLLNVVHAAGVPLLVLSLALPYGTFLPLIWGATGLGVLLSIYLLTHILLETRSRVALWYAASISVALLASTYEILAAAGGLKAFIGTLNSVTAALVSSLLTSLAIAERMRQEHEHKLALQAELQHAYEVIPIGLFTLDLRGRFMSANPAMTDLLGPVDDNRSSWRQHFGNQAWLALFDKLQSGQAVEMEIGTTDADGKAKADGKRFWVKAALAGEKIEGSLQDITDKAKANDHLHFLANHDPLTKVLNRRGIESALQSGLNHLARGRPLALAYLDLDRFKLINDLYGHNAGDEVLQQVCKRVQQPLGLQMSVGRVGGDEFLLVMANTPLVQAEAICREVVGALGSTPYLVSERAFQVRGSIGLIEVTHGTSAKDAVSTADRACREAKKGQHAGLVVYDKDSRVFREHEAEMQLVERLASNQSIEGLFIEMQPIMSLRAPYQSLNFEVLLRMHDENGNRVPTDRLIHAGENAGRMDVIDRWVLSTTLDWLRQHADELGNNQFVCMNLSGASLNDENFMEDVFAMLDRNREIASKLCLEITESVALHDLGNTRRFIDKTRSYGTKVALDDFGAGYTSFSYLKDLPADLLKIDGSFIVNMNRHPANVAIVEAIVSLAQNLGMKTVAEWAEDFETVETLAEIGVDYVQGFVVARPQNPVDMLTASSSAAFIKDEALGRYISTLAPEDNELANVDLVLGHDLLRAA